MTIPRPAEKTGEPSPKVPICNSARSDLRARLLAGLPADAAAPDTSHHGRWLLAYLVDWHSREENASWWEYFRLIETPAEDLFEEPDAMPA